MKKPKKCSTGDFSALARAVRINRAAAAPSRRISGCIAHQKRLFSDGRAPGAVNPREIKRIEKLPMERK
jgi:hypothetical protein